MSLALSICRLSKFKFKNSKIQKFENYQVCVCVRESGVITDDKKVGSMLNESDRETASERERAIIVQ